MTWETCIWCDPDGPDGNLWPADAFGACGNAYPAGNRPCDACWKARYPHRMTECSACGVQMKTRGKRTPKCRPCRRKARPRRRRVYRACERCGGRSRGVVCRRCRLELARAVRPVRERKPRKRVYRPERGKMVTFSGFRFERREAA